MQIPENLRHEASGRRARYLRGLLVDGWNTLFGVFRSAGNFLNRVKSGKTRGNSARILQNR
jgi:hypothetical protein